MLGFQLQRRCFPLLVFLTLPVMAQQTENQLWPETDVFVKLGENTRLFLLGSGTRIEEQGNTDGTVGAHVDFFTSPLFKKRMDLTAKRADVSRNRFLHIRIGYLYSHSSTRSAVRFTENTPTAEITPRYYLPRHFLITSRSRVDLRLLDGVFTPRFRQRLKLERTFEFKWTAITPYGHAEVFYDWRYHAFHRFRYTAGMEWELNKHFVLEGYYTRQRDNRSATRFLNIAGVSAQFYFR
jgi:hypothetical protein